MIYLDTSLLAKAFTTETHSKEILALLHGPEMIFTSVLTHVEIVSALRRLVRQKVLKESVYRMIEGHLAAEWQRLEAIPLSDDVLDLAREVLERHPLRASDAVQLASALKIHQVRAIRFGAADKRLVRAADLEGFEALELSK